MNFKSFTKKQWKSFILATLFVIFGILFCVLSQKLLNVLESIVCICVLIYGGFYMVSYCVVSMGERDTTTLYQAVLAIAFGLLLIFVPSFFVIAISAVIILSGLGYILSYVKIKKAKLVGGGKNLACGIVLSVIGLGLLIISLLKVNPIVVSIYLGITLILDGVISLIALWQTSNNKEETTKENVEQTASEVQE